MGPGHLGLGFAAKPTADKVPLWLLLIATEVLDILVSFLRRLGLSELETGQDGCGGAISLQSLG